MALLTLQDVAVNLGDTSVLDGVDLHLEKGEFISILGPSGCGKSTLLKMLTGAIQPDGGQVQVDGAPLNKDQRHFAYMPQRDALMPWRRIIDNVTLGLEVQGVTRAKARETVVPLFAKFGLAGVERHFPHQLSGGMRQRAAFMRTIVQNRQILLLDEPFSALDALMRVEMQRWLETHWQREQWSTILITHDVREAIVLSDRIFVLSRRPAQVVAEIAVPLPRPRQGPDFLQAAAQIETDILARLLT